VIWWDNHSESSIPIGISFRRKDHVSVDVVWTVFEKVSQSNSRFNALDTLVIAVHSVKMLVWFGGGIKTKDITLSVMAHLKKISVYVKAEIMSCYALVIAIAKVDNDANYKPYRECRKIRSVVQTIVQGTGIELTNGAGIPDFNRLYGHFRDYKIVVYQGFGCDDTMFEGQVDSSKRLNLLYHDVKRHYHVIVNLKGAMVRPYVFSARHKSCRRDLKHVCDQTCSDCMARPPCTFSDVRSPCHECNNILEAVLVTTTTSRAHRLKISI